MRRSSSVKKPAPPSASQSRGGPPSAKRTTDSGARKVSVNSAPKLSVGKTNVNAAGTKPQGGYKTADPPSSSSSGSSNPRTAARPKSPPASVSSLLALAAKSSITPKEASGTVAKAVESFNSTVEVSGASWAAVLPATLEPQTADGSVQFASSADGSRKVSVPPTGLGSVKASGIEFRAAVPSVIEPKGKVTSSFDEATGLTADFTTSSADESGSSLQVTRTSSSDGASSTQATVAIPGWSAGHATLKVVEGSGDGGSSGSLLAMDGAAKLRSENQRLCEVTFEAPIISASGVSSVDCSAAAATTFSLESGDELKATGGAAYVNSSTTTAREGSATSKKGGSLTGNFARGKMEGNGSAEVKSGKMSVVLSGPWAKGERHGAGGKAVIAVEGDSAFLAQHEGPQLEDSRHGAGNTRIRLPAAAGSTKDRLAHITGTWDHGKLSGQVAIAIDSAERYRSVWEDGRPTLQASLVMPTGVFNGEWDAPPSRVASSLHPSQLLPDSATNVSALLGQLTNFASTVNGSAAATKIFDAAESSVSLPLVSTATMAEHAARLEVGVAGATCWDAVGAAGLMELQGSQRTVESREKELKLIEKETATLREQAERLLNAAGEEQKRLAAARAATAAEEAKLASLQEAKSKEVGGDLKQSIQSTQETTRELTDRLRTAMSTINERKSEVRVAKQKADALQQDVSELEKDNRRVTDHIANCEASLTSSTDKLASQRAEYERLLADAEARCKTSNEKLESLQASAETAKGSLESLKAKVESATSEMSAPSPTKGDIVATLQSQLDARDKEMMTIRGEIAEIRKTASKTNAHRHELEGEVSVIESDQQAAQRHAADLKSRIKELQIVVDKSEAEGGSQLGSRQSMEDRHAKAMAVHKKSTDAAAVATERAQTALAELQVKLADLNATYKSEKKRGPSSNSSTPVRPTSTTQDNEERDRLQEAVNAKLARCSTLSKQRDNLSSKISDAQSAVDKAKRKAAQEASEVGVSAEEVGAQSAEDLKASLDATKKSNESLNAEIEVKRQTLAALNADLKQLRSDADANSATQKGGKGGDWRVAALQQEVDAREQRIADLRARLKRIPLLEAKLSAARETLTNMSQSTQARKQHGISMAKAESFRSFHR